MKKKQRAKFFSNNLKEWIEGVVVKENEKTVWLELPDSYKIVITDIPLPLPMQVKMIADVTGMKTSIRIKDRELDKGVPNIIKKKRKQVTFL